MSIPKHHLLSLIDECRVLERAQIQRISQPSHDEFVFQLRRPGHTHHLYLQLAAPDERIHLIPSKPPSLPTPPAFCMRLRKTLMNGRIESFTLLNDDRIVDIAIHTHEETMHLILELLPRRANLLLCDSEHAILQSYKAIPAERGLRRGDPYEAPTQPERNTSRENKSVPQNNQDLPEGWEDFPTHFAIATRYEETTQARRLTQIRQRALRTRRNELKKWKRLVGHLSRDIERCQQTLSREHDGELLKHHMHLFKRGDSSVEVVDYYDPAMTKRAIALDPALNPQDNIARLFKKIKRAKKGLAAIEPRLEEAEYKQLELEEDIEKIAAIDDLETLLECLPNEPTEATQKRSRKQQTSSPFREYRSSDGKKILVGRNSRHNDTLTFRIARGNDTWLHVRGIPGSHVLLPTGKQEQPTTEQLLDAATLAAHFSKARGEIHVDVMVTQAKYVKKPKGAPPGQVMVLNDKNIALRVEEERLTRLLQNERNQEEKKP
jgi:predicted ribosome quality control (RQC) complex YloA/Tae2 family protein